MVDPALTQDDLSALGDRLDLSEGWRYRVRELDEDFTVLTVRGLAHVIQDDLKNTYQRVDE
jgi:haloalkane dehalogenase